MAIQRIDHVGIVVNDLPAATKFFLDLGFKLEGESGLEGPWLDRIIGLTGAKTEFTYLTTPDGQALEIVKFLSPSDDSSVQPLPANAPGMRHLAFEVDDIEATVSKLKAMGAELFSEIQQYEDIYKLIYVRGPEGMILEFAEKIG